MMFCRPVPVNVDVSLVTKRGRLRPTAAGRHNQFPMNIFLELICDNIDLIEQLAILRRCAFARFVVGLRRPYLCLLLKTVRSALLSHLDRASQRTPLFSY